MSSHFTQEIDVIQIQQPVRIVDHHGLSFGKIDKTAHLLLEAVAVVLNRIHSHHLA